MFDRVINLLVVSLRADHARAFLKESRESAMVGCKPDYEANAERGGDAFELISMLEQVGLRLPADDAEVQF